VRNVVPHLWEGKKSFFRLFQQDGTSNTFRIDAMLHIGMLGRPHENFRIERQSFKGKYISPDVDRRTPTEEDQNPGGRWDGLPDKLVTHLDIDAICNQVADRVRVRNSRGGPYAKACPFPSFCSGSS
jgi:hypothetical protein